MRFPRLLPPGSAPGSDSNEIMRPSVPLLASLAVRLSVCLVVASVTCCLACDYSISAGPDLASLWIRAQVGSSECATAVPDTADIAPRPVSLASLPWPDGTQVLRFEDLEGAILVRARLVSASGRDTSGVLILDTGAGFLALDLDLARLFGVADYASGAAAVDLAARPLARLELGGLQVDQVWPVLTVDAGVIRRVTGRPVLGLLGHALFRDRVVMLDYLEGILVLLPPETGPGSPFRAVGLALAPGAVPVPFRLAGDGKVLVRARVSGRRGPSAEELTLIVDTGATKCVFFREALDRRLPGWGSWPALRGLGAPTLTGDASAELVRVPGIEFRAPGASVARGGVDAAVLQGDLGRALARAAGEPVEGLLGYSFLKHYRIALDYPRRLLWLDGSRGDVADRLEEYSHPGLQLESVGGEVRIFAVAEGSPAAHAGILAGDVLVAIDGESVTDLDVVAVARKLEGAPGTALLLGLRRGPREWTCRVVRKLLL